MSASSLKEVLVACPMPKALAGSLEKVWILPTEQVRLLLNYPYENEPSRPSAGLGEGLLTYLTGLVSRREKGIKGYSFTESKNLVEWLTPTVCSASH